MKRKAWIFITAGISIALALVAAAKTNQRKKEPSMKQPVVLTVNSREIPHGSRRERIGRGFPGKAADDVPDERAERK